MIFPIANNVHSVQKKKKDNMENYKQKRNKKLHISLNTAIIFYNSK